MDRAAIQGELSRRCFRQICLQSPRGVIRGHNSLIHPVNVWWMRDQFLGGYEQLRRDFESILEKGVADAVLAEKRQCVAIWQEMMQLGRCVRAKDSRRQDFIRVSTEYGYHKYSIIEAGWTILLRSMQAKSTEMNYLDEIIVAYDRYQKSWSDWQALKDNESTCPTLYEPVGFDFTIGPPYHTDKGMGQDIDSYIKQYLNL